MRIVLFGAGAMGSLVGGLLSRENHVVLIGRKEHVEAINKRGLSIKGRTNLVVHPVAKEEIEGDENPDWVIVTTKSYDTQAAMEALTPFHKRSIFISFQNGLDSEDVISRFAPKVVGGVTSHGVTLEAPGTIYHAGLGRTIVGDYQGSGEVAREVSKVMTKAGISTDVTKDIRTEIWRKVIVNAGINPITAITRCRNGAILKTPSLERTLETVCEEAVRVANAHGIRITPEESIARAKDVARMTADNKSSMLQDIERGKRTEIESICGAVVRFGREKGIPTPVNSTLLAIVKGMETLPSQESKK